MLLRRGVCALQDWTAAADTPIIATSAMVTMNPLLCICQWDDAHTVCHVALKLNYDE